MVYICGVIINTNMAHGNKKFFFEDLKQSGDRILCSPNKGSKRINPYSSANQLRKYFIESNEKFEYDTVEHRNGSITVIRK